MDIHQAISHCKENESRLGTDTICGKEHLQLAKWLDELIHLKARIQTCKKCGKEYLDDSHEYPCPYCTPRDEEHELRELLERSSRALADAISNADNIAYYAKVTMNKVDEYINN